MAFRMFGDRQKLFVVNYLSIKINKLDSYNESTLKKDKTKRLSFKLVF